MRISDWIPHVCPSDLAFKAAKAIGVRILSLEEGYIRPGYVTVEPDGNNADSPLAGRLPPEDFVEDRKAQEQAVDYDSFRTLDFYAAVYYPVPEQFSPPRQAGLFHRRVAGSVEIASLFAHPCRRVCGQQAADRRVGEK